ncbi:MAG TPA: hypothetical protein VEC36_01895, partial [Patescibacteria group bacterium]|nr:hypothetical protein [Patescibacteria group bacterium]
TEFHNQHTENLPPKIKRLLKIIFPELNAVGELALGNDDFHYSNEAEWKNEKRICSPEYCETYFQLNVPLDSISEREFLEILELTNEKEKFKNCLLELQGKKRSDGFSKLSVLLNLISNRAKTQTLKNKSEDLIRCLLFEIDELSEEIEPVGFARMQRNYETIALIIIQLLNNLEEQQRFNLLLQLSADKLSIVTLARTINALQWEHDGNQQNTTISPEELNRLKGIIVASIRAMAENGELLNTVPDLYLILLLWKSWASVDEMKSWVDRIIVDDDNLVMFLRKNLGLGWNSVQGGVYRIDYGYISEILDIPQTAERLERLNYEENLTGLHKVAARIITNLNKSPRKDSFPITEVRSI